MRRFTNLLGAAQGGAGAEDPAYSDQEKGNLLRNVSGVLKLLQKEASTLKAHETIRQSANIQGLCGALELIFRHGLSSQWHSVLSGPSFWTIAGRISRKDAIQYIKGLSHAKSDHARARAWIRLAINEHSLESYITVLMQDAALLRESYEEHAFMRDEERGTIFKSLLAGMSFTMSFDIPVNDATLEYEPTPVAVGTDPDAPAPNGHHEPEQPTDHRAAATVQPDPAPETATIPGSHSHTPDDAPQLPPNTPHTAEPASFGATDAVVDTLPVATKVERKRKKKKKRSKTRNVAAETAHDPATASPPDDAANARTTQIRTPTIESPEREHPQPHPQPKPEPAARAETPEACTELPAAPEPGAAPDEHEGEGVDEAEASPPRRDLTPDGPRADEPATAPPTEETPDGPVAAPPLGDPVAAPTADPDPALPEPAEPEVPLRPASPQADNPSPPLPAELEVPQPSTPSPTPSPTPAHEEPALPAWPATPPAAAQTSVPTADIDMSPLPTSWALEDDHSEDEDEGQEGDQSGRDSVSSSEAGRSWGSPPSFAAHGGLVTAEPTQPIATTGSRAYAAPPPSTGAASWQINPNIAQPAPEQPQPQPQPQLPAQHNRVPSPTAAGQVGSPQGQSRLQRLEPTSPQPDPDGFVMLDNYFAADTAGAEEEPVVVQHDTLDDLHAEIGARLDHIELSKERLALGDEMSKETQAAVTELVDLRLRHQQAMERLAVEAIAEDAQYGDVDVAWMDHLFRPKPVHASASKAAKQATCQVCKKPFRGLKSLSRLQCAGCRMSVHKKCLNRVVRQCVTVRVAMESYEPTVCPNEGLSAQGYRCYECKGQISYQGIFGEARLCDYSGKYFCANCHHNEVMINPVRVLHNWDFSAYPVAVLTREMLTAMQYKPLIHLEKSNPSLLSHVEELKELHRHRVAIMSMRLFLTSCRKAKDLGMLTVLNKRKHFLESVHWYSLKDLIELRDGRLLPDLQSARSKCETHIKTECELCMARGFFCELCKSRAIIYPFDVGVTKCSRCKACFHSLCFADVDGKCPKCLRIRKRNASISSSGAADD